MLLPAPELVHSPGSACHGQDCARFFHWNIVFDQSEPAVLVQFQRIGLAVVVAHRDSLVPVFSDDTVDIVGGTLEDCHDISAFELVERHFRKEQDVSVDKNVAHAFAMIEAAVRQNVFLLVHRSLVNPLKEETGPGDSEETP